VYCTLQQARTAGTTGTDAEVTAWITAAQEAITRYTLQLFEPTPLVVVADVGAGGLVTPPPRVRTVTSVTPVVDSGSAPVLPASAYRVTSADVLGDIDSVRLRWDGYDDLVAGAESYTGGWRGLWERWGHEQARIEGVFGYAAVPPLVAEACALLAAHLQAAVVPSDADAAQAPGLAVDDEGNNVRIEDASSGVGGSSSTGSTQVDGLLSGYLNHGPSLIGGV
jgi:hypothetical protein